MNSLSFAKSPNISPNKKLKDAVFKTSPVKFDKSRNSVRLSRISTLLEKEKPMEPNQFKLKLNQTMKLT